MNVGKRCCQASSSPCIRKWLLRKLYWTFQRLCWAWVKSRELCENVGIPHRRWEKGWDWCTPPYWESTSTWPTIVPLCHCASVSAILFLCRWTSCGWLSRRASSWPKTSRARLCCSTFITPRWSPLTASSLDPVTFSRFIRDPTTKFQFYLKVPWGFTWFGRISCWLNAFSSAICPRRHPLQVSMASPRCLQSCPIDLLLVFTRFSWPLRCFPSVCFPLLLYFC